MDKAWHELLLDTEEYAKHCERLGTPFVHHNPDGGAEAERPQRYARTLQMYREIFACEPHPLAWESVQEVQQMTDRALQGS